MNFQSNRLRNAVEQRKDELKSELIRYGYYKTPDGKQLFELTLTELEQIHINVKYQYAKEMDE